MNLQKPLEKFSDVSEIKELQELSLEYTGITLNNQDIDLMMIATSETFDDLEERLRRITNIKSTVDRSASVEEERQRIFNLYMQSLTHKVEYLKNPSIRISKKIDYLKQSGILSSEEVTLLDRIISTSSNQQEMMRNLVGAYSQNPSKLHQMYKTLRDYTPVEKTGVIGTSLEAYRNLYHQIQQNYNSITIDEEAKYGSIVLADGTFDFDHLQKALDFARDNGKQVRLNTLIFYMDCPEYLYQLPKTEEAKQLVKQRLMDYVSATTKFIADKDRGYSDVVRSYDVFNELLNRFPMNGEVHYMYRGDIPQYGQNVDDNIKAGWLKHLDILDLCDVIAEARKNLPTADFMFNDDNLTDPDKIVANKELISKIHEYERLHGVTLIDSIGTQMHIDNDLSKDAIENMIRELSSFGLPIEITEFDVAMTKGVEGLSDIEIETLRQQKINEVYSVVESLRGECNIRGFTIWSKTDRQNFRVSLDNEIRIKDGRETIDSLHGGVFTESMELKSKAYSKVLLKNDFQSFNYHTHTNRCGHASMAEDSEYVARAKANGITQLGFSDHVPVPELAYQDFEHQMHVSEVDEYVESIRQLQAENPDMKINVGFEAEFDPMKEQFFGELREKVDYMILGQHFVPGVKGLIKQRDNPDYPLQYADMVCKAMDSGIFDIVAHPDIFMQYRDSLSSEESRKQFDANAVIASKQICAKAKEIGIPVELNLSAIDNGRVMSDGKYPYPHPMFWEEAARSGVQVLYGVDAHDPRQFDAMGWNRQVADQIVDPRRLNIVSPNYNPVEARKNNLTLQEKYANGQKFATTYETNLVTQLMFGMLSKAEITSMDELLPGEVDGMFKNVSEAMQREAEQKKINIEKKADDLVTNKTTLEVKKERISQTLANRESTLDRAKQTLKDSIKIGCNSKHDVISGVSKITEANTSKKANVKEKMMANVERTKQSSPEKAIQHEKPKVFVKENNTSSNNRLASSNSKSASSSGTSSSNKGFTNVISLIFVIASILGIVFLVGYMFCKNIIG